LILISARKFGDSDVKCLFLDTKTFLNINRSLSSNDSVLRPKPMSVEIGWLLLI
jgi:hypothetical protein